MRVFVRGGGGGEEGSVCVRGREGGCVRACVVGGVVARKSQSPLIQKLCIMAVTGSGLQGEEGVRKLVIRLHSACVLKTKLLGKLRVEARRHAAKRLADRHVWLTDCFSHGALSPVKHTGLYQG